MKRWLVGVGAALVLLVIGAVLLSFFLWHEAVTHPSTSVPIGSVATAVGSLFGAVAAIGAVGAALAAFAAAERSDLTASRAVEALGLAMRPSVAVSQSATNGGDPVLLLWNPSSWPATQIEVEWCPAYGNAVTNYLARLEPVAVDNEGRPVDVTKGRQVPFVQPEPPEIADPNFRGARSWSDRLVVRFSDDRGLLRWQVVRDLPQSYRHVDGESGIVRQRTHIDGIGNPTRVD